MPNENDNNENENEEVSIEDLRAAAARSSQNKTEAELAKRELALVKAGVDTDSKIGKLILNQYDGELTTDAIKAYVSDIPGALAAPVQEQQQEQQDTTDEERRQTEERNRLAGDSRGDLPPVVGAREEATKVWKEAREAGLPTDEARARQFNTLVAGAMNGDESVVLKNPVGAE